MGEPIWSSDTQVSFPAGSLVGKSSLRWAGTVERSGRRLVGFVTDATPFHPEDIVWPDQPGDRGSVVVGGHQISVTDSITLAAARDAPLSMLQDVQPKRGDTSHHFLVFHQIDSGDLEGLAEPGQEVCLSVDRRRRAGLSAAHTAAHLMALALNEATSSLWIKPTRLDSLGHPNFDQLFVKSSKIEATLCRDVYRVGRSARKAGFNAEGMLENLDQMASAITARVNAWISTDAKVAILASATNLSAARTWRCVLPEGTAAIPCGGTHVEHLKAVGEVSIIAVRRSEDQSEFEVRTVVTDAAG